MVHSFEMELRNPKWRDEVMPRSAAYRFPPLQIAAALQLNTF